MVGRNGTTFLSEEDRLEAQRRMLAERFGLKDDDDDEENATNEASVEAEESGGVGEPSLADDRGDGKSGHMTGSRVSATSLSSSAPLANESLHVLHDDVDLRDKPVASEALAESRSETPEYDMDSLWPGVVLFDLQQGSHEHPLPSYAYDSAKHSASTSERECRVTQITLYNSIYQESIGRKIAVNDLLICYAVGGHIRALARNSTQRILLKGHGSSVRDIEFAQVTHNGHESTGAAPGVMAVLGSVAEDGSVIVWKLARDISAGATENANRGGADVAHDENATSISLELVDSIRLDHPIKGKSYQNVSFRPSEGAVLSDRGVGVALLLLDETAADLRLTELVKMGDKSMVLDKSLSGGHKSVHGEGLSAAVWVSNEIIATSRGSEVCLWSVSDQACIFTLERPAESNAVVSSLHVLDRRAENPSLLVTSENGRILELWSLASSAKCASLSQKVRLYHSDVTDVFNVVARDTAVTDFVVVSNVKGKALFVLHFHAEHKCFDALTEIPVKQPVLSLCVTKNVRTLVDISSRASSDVSAAEDLGIWCVQPRCIQMIHVFAKDCEPPVMKTNGKSGEGAVVLPGEAGSKSSVLMTSVPTKTPAIELRKSRDVKIATPRSTSTTTRAAPSPAITILRKPSGPSTGAATEAVPDNGLGRVVAGRNTPGEFDENASGSPETARASTRGGGRSDRQGKSLENAEMGLRDEQGVKVEAPEDAVERKAAGLTAEALDEIVAAVVAAANKVVADFDEEGTRRQATEMARIDPLVKSVRQTAETNLAEYVTDAMKVPMTDSIIPAVSEIVATASARVSSADAIAASAVAEASSSSTEFSGDWFVDVFRSSDLGPSFENACQEMARQAGAAVKDSMGQKFGALVEPSMNAMESNAHDAAVASKSFVANARAYLNQVETWGLSADDRVDTVTEDTKSSIERLVGAGNTNEAFEYAVEHGSSEDIVWLCRQFDPDTFFNDYSLTQSCLLTLAKRLGQDISTDSVLKVVWLNEILLVLEPGEEEIASRAPPTLQLILGNLEALRRDRKFQAQAPEFAKKSKGLALLLSSLSN
jgi:hypothetical protein